MAVNKKDDFRSWLLAEMEQRKLTQADLARKTGLSTAAISLLIGSGRGAGPEICRALARAFVIPEEYVFRKAGLLSPKSDYDFEYEEWREILHRLNDKQRGDLMRIAMILLEYGE